MNYISASGNLTKTPVLRQGEKGPYTYATVAVSDRYKTDTGYANTPAEYYEVLVNGARAINLVDVAQACGNICIDFAGPSRRVPDVDQNGNVVFKNKVTADKIGIDLMFQKVRVVREGNPAPAAAQPVPAAQPPSFAQQSQTEQLPAAPTAGAAPVADPIDEAVNRWTNHSASA